MSQSPLFPKTPIPCIHVWEFKRSDVWDDYFVCKNCHKEVPYDPQELAELVAEMGVEE